MPRSLTTTTLRRRSLVVSAVVMLALPLAACGGGSGPTGNASGGECSGDATGVTATEVRLGALSPESGPSAETFVGFQEGVRARIDEQNAQGGVNGRTITIVPGDDQGDGGRQVTAARALVQDGEVFGIVAGLRADTMFPYLKQKDVPVIALPTVPAFGTDRNAFGTTGAFAPKVTTTATADFLKSRGATKIALPAHNSPGSTGSAKLVAAAARQVGLQVGYSPTDIPLGNFDATATVLRMREDGDDALYSPLLTASALSLVQALSAQGIDLKAAVLAGIYDRKVLAQAGGRLEGAWGSTAALKPLEIDDPAVKKYIAIMDRRAPGFGSTIYAGYGYGAADLFVHGLQLAGDCVTRDHYIDALRTSDGYDADGLLYNKVSFKPGSTPDGDPPACLWFAQVTGTSFTPTAQPTCGNRFSFG